MPAEGALLAAAVLSGALLTGCSFGWTPPPEICVPELDVQPTLASPGESVEVTTARACPLEPPAGGWLVRVQPEGGQSHWVDGRVQPSSDGSFTIAMMLPPDMPTGPALASIVNWWEVAECPDNASCAAAEGSFEVVPPQISD
jgi:hypothetical protein